MSRTLGLTLVIVGMAAGLMLAPAIARTFAPIDREVVVRPVSNGYIVTLKDQRNPYPAIEHVETTTDAAGKAVAVLLTTPFPKSKWGN